MSDLERGAEHVGEGLGDAAPVAGVEDDLHAFAVVVMLGNEEGGNVEIVPGGAAPLAPVRSSP